MEQHSNTPVIPTNDDVLCGSGNMKSAHPGNQELKRIVLKHFTEYEAAKTRSEMMRISKRILLEVSSRGARFLRKHPIFDEWYIQEDPKAVRDKISHILRDLKRTYTTTETHQENRVRGPVNLTRRFNGGCSEQMQRNLVRVVPTMDESNTTNTLIASNTTMADDRPNTFTSFVLHWHHSSGTSMLGGEWKPDACCNTIFLVDHDAEQQREVEKSGLELQLRKDSEVLLPNGSINNFTASAVLLRHHSSSTTTSILGGEEWKPEDCCGPISLLDHDAKLQEEVGSKYSVLDLILSEDWEFLP